MLVLTYFEHGGHGLVTKIKPAGGTEISFSYDALLRRVKMVEGAVTTSFKHDGIDLLEVSDSSGNLTKITHGYKVIDGIGSVVEIEVNGTRYYLHQDDGGTTYKITNSSGDVVWTGLCDAWGNVISETGTNPSIFWYQGQAWWKLTVNGRLYYVSPTRIYDVQDGRLIERDPLRGLSGKYGFPSNNPVTAVDPTGMKIIVAVDISKGEDFVNHVPFIKFLDDRIKEINDELDGWIKLASEARPNPKTKELTFIFNGESVTREVFIEKLKSYKMEKVLLYDPEDDKLPRPANLKDKAAQKLKGLLDNLGPNDELIFETHTGSGGRFEGEIKIGDVNVPSKDVIKVLGSDKKRQGRFVLGTCIMTDKGTEEISKKLKLPTAGSGGISHEYGPELELKPSGEIEHKKGDFARFRLEVNLKGVYERQDFRHTGAEQPRPPANKPAASPSPAST